MENGGEQMIDCYKTDRECLRDALEKADKFEERYNNLIKKINKGIKEHRTLAEGTKNKDYALAHSMIADYLQELKEEVQNGK